MTAAELIERYEAGERDFAGADLRWADLRGADLSGAFLRLGNRQFTLTPCPEE